MSTPGGIRPIMSQSPRLLGIVQHVGVKSIIRLKVSRPYFVGVHIHIGYMV